MNNDLKYYADTVIVETIIGDSGFAKRAGTMSDMLSGAASTIKEYVNSHIDPNDKVGSIIDMLAPDAIYSIFKLFGFGTLGMLLSTVASALHIDVAGMVRPLWEEVKESLTKGKTVSPDKIDEATTKTIENHMPSDQSNADAEGKFARNIREARMLRLALEQGQSQMLRLTKQQIPMAKMFVLAASRTGRATSLIGTILGWIFKTVLMSAGFMVAGDLANKMLGQPNAIDKTYQAGQSPSEPATSAPAPISTQNKLSQNPSYHDVSPSRPWMENVANNPESIEEMLVNFTKQVYSGLDGHEEWITASPTFQAVKNQIVWYNHNAAGEPMVYIPGNFASKKALVDRFIDEVAANVPDSPKPLSDAKTPPFLANPNKGPGI